MMTVLLVGIRMLTFEENSKMVEIIDTYATPDLLRSCVD
jgi:hypothetical protein